MSYIVDKKGTNYFMRFTLDAAGDLVIECGGDSTIAAPAVPGLLRYLRRRLTQVQRAAAKGKQA